MLNFWLSEKNTNLIINLFQKKEFITEVIIFWSRAIWTYQNNSDIDLAIKWNFDKFKLWTLELDLEELNTPYLFDLIDYQNISNKKLEEHINTKWIIFYKKP